MWYRYLNNSAFHIFMGMCVFLDGIFQVFSLPDASLIRVIKGVPCSSRLNTFTMNVGQWTSSNIPTVTSHLHQSAHVQMTGWNETADLWTGDKLSTVRKSGPRSMSPFALKSLICSVFVSPGNLESTLQNFTWHMYVPSSPPMWAASTNTGCLVGRWACICKVNLQVGWWKNLWNISYVCSGSRNYSELLLTFINLT